MKGARTVVVQQLLPVRAAFVVVLQSQAPNLSAQLPDSAAAIVFSA